MDPEVMRFDRLLSRRHRPGARKLEVLGISVWREHLRQQTSGPGDFLPARLRVFVLAHGLGDQAIAAHPILRVNAQHLRRFDVGVDEAHALGKSAAAGSVPRERAAISAAAMRPSRAAMCALFG
jgi:hypothetical protein